MKFIWLAAILISVVWAERNSEKTPRLSLETCHDVAGRPWIGYFPAMFNCSTYFVCHQAFDGVPSAVQMHCPIFVDAGGQARLLIWNFEKCSCDFPDSARCYNYDNDSVYRFDCAKPLWSQT